MFRAPTPRVAFRPRLSTSFPSPSPVRGEILGFLPLAQGGYCPLVGR
ncbi:MAG: hypothetical protein NZ846_10640 [Thermus sp.]|nr:hypothetical protein [Thermus sp.]MCS7219408.1 hypothetical protein [Thermus sp.]MDW8017793.1 hypothetical protein [Thermus sp.]